MKRLSVLVIPIFFLILGSCSCDPERMAKGVFWGFQKLVGEGYFPSDEILAIGDFEGVEVHVTTAKDDQGTKKEIQLWLHNGKHPKVNEENVARKVAEIYAEDYSKISQYQTLTLRFIQSDPFVPDNYQMTEYHFDINDLTNQKTSDYGF